MMYANRQRYRGPNAMFYPAIPFAARAGYHFARSAYRTGKQALSTITTNPKSKKQFRKSRKSVRSFPKKVNHQIRELKRLAESDMGTHTHRFRNVGRVLASAGESTLTSYPFNDVTTLEAVIAQLRYYNPSAPTTLVTADGTSGTYQKEFLIEKSYGSVRIRNNYQVPVRVRLYLCTPKDDTDIAPHNAVTNGLTDVGNPSSTSLLVYPNDSPQFRDLWSVQKSTSCLLQPGSEKMVTHSSSAFQYDPSFNDSHNLTYQKKYKSAVIMFRVEGVLGHDTTLDEQNTLQAGIDWEVVRVIKVKYAAGADIEFVFVNDGGDTFTNGGVVSSKPVSDNLGYSVS